MLIALWQLPFTSIGIGSLPKGGMDFKENVWGLNVCVCGGVAKIAKGKSNKILIAIVVCDWFNKQWNLKLLDWVYYKLSTLPIL